MISLEKVLILTPLQKLPKNERDLGKLIVAKGLKSCPKSNKSPNLVTLETTQVYFTYFTYFSNLQINVLISFDYFRSTTTNSIETTKPV